MAFEDIQKDILKICWIRNYFVILLSKGNRFWGKIAYRSEVIRYMQINQKNSIRKAFGNALKKIGADNSKIVVMDADLSCSTQTKIFHDAFPDRFYNCGIAEQNMIATAAGLASEGKIPFVSSFAMFATGRTYDQIRNAVCYPDFNVKIIGTHGGITVGEDGATHQALEDISLMRSIPYMTVVVPADCKECEEVIKYAANHIGPMYIRISRSNVYDIFDDKYKFDISRARVLKHGNDLTVLTNGETLAESLMAAYELDKIGYSIEVINVPVIKPIDVTTILESAKKTKLVMTVENHSIIGGLGSAVCETLSSRNPVKIFRVGVRDEFGQSGKAEELMKYYGLDAKSLEIRFKNILKEEKGL